MLIIRRTRALLRACNPEQRYFYGARIDTDERDRLILTTYWRNPELAGIWEFKYHVQRKCLSRGLLLKTLEFDSLEKCYRITQKGL